MNLAHNGFRLKEKGKVHKMKNSPWRSTGIPSCIINMAVGGVVRFTHRPLFSYGHGVRCSLHRTQRGLQESLWPTRKAHPISQASSS